MRILKIIHCFPPESMTGAEIYAYYLSKELYKNHEVSIFYRANNPREEEYKVTEGAYDGLKVYKINNTLKGYNIEKIYNNKAVESRFIEVLEKVKPDIIHIHHLLFLSIGIIDEIKKRNIPIIFTLHDYWLVCPRGQLIKNSLRVCRNSANANCLFCLGIGLNIKNLFKRIKNFHAILSSKGKKPDILKDISEKVDLFISPSKFLRERFIEFGIPPEKVMHSDNGMDLSLFQYKDLKKIYSDKIRFGFIGTLIPSKGAHILIKAFNKIKGDRAILKIYGKPPINNGIFDYYYRIKMMAWNNKNIKFMGIYDNRDVVNIFKEIDVLVFPSLWQENSPLVLHEAILTGTPVIASDSGGAPEFIENNKNGYLFKPGDTEELFYYMMKIVQNPEERNNLKGSFNSIKDIRHNAAELEELYCKLLKCQ